MSKIFLSWETPEYIAKTRTSDWFWAVGIIAAALIITSILLNNVLLAVFLLITTITVFIYAKRKPDTINIQITDHGIRAGRNIYPYSTIKSFWIREETEPAILLKTGSVLNPIIVIPVPIANINPEKIRSILLEYTSEELTDEPFLQKLLEYLGF